jgi:FkbM family methyltransferase
MAVLDIGANVGCHTLRCAQLVGPSGSVIAFEPAAQAFRRLRRNCVLNAFTNITLEQLALADAGGRRDVTLACSWPLSGADDSRRHAIHGGVGVPGVVEFVTLDAYVRDRGVGRIDLVKLDVDGYEDKVVRGGAATLRAHRPLLVMELGVYSVAEAGDRVEDLLARLASWGYRFYDERTLRPFPDLGALRVAIPLRATINVVAAVRELEAVR